MTTVFVDVTQFGAAGDGVTDDTAAIATALANIPTSTGGVLYFPPNHTFLVSHVDISAYSGSLVIMGGGWSSVLSSRMGRMTGLSRTRRAASSGQPSAISSWIAMRPTRPQHQAASMATSGAGASLTLCGFTIPGKLESCLLPMSPTLGIRTGFLIVSSKVG